jgi:hypothetical protein
VGILLRQKGQMFLISSVVIVIVLILLRFSINLPDVVHNKKDIEGKIVRETFENIKTELVKTIEISYHQSNNITSNVFDFSNFTRKKMNERLLDFKLLYIGSITPESGSDMNVTVINLLKESINASLNLNGSLQNNDNILDSTNWITTFTIVSGQDYILTVSYNDTYQSNITIETESGKSKYIAFFDIFLTGLGTTYKDKFQKSYTLP